MAKESRQKLLNDLNELASFLNDGPEQQQEMPLPQAELFDGKEVPDPGDLPILTAFIDQPDDTAGNTQLDALVDAMVQDLMPRLERELKRRLKARLAGTQV